MRGKRRFWQSKSTPHITLEADEKSRLTTEYWSRVLPGQQTHLGSGLQQVLWETCLPPWEPQKGRYRGSALCGHLPPRKAGAPCSSGNKVNPGTRTGCGGSLDRGTNTPWPSSQAVSLLLHNVTPIYLDCLPARLHPARCCLSRIAYFCNYFQEEQTLWSPWGLPWNSLSHKGVWVFLCPCSQGAHNGVGHLNSHSQWNLF